MAWIESKGNFPKTRQFLKKLSRSDNYLDLDRFGQMGVEALASATPVDTGLTKESWGYRLIQDGNKPTIEWFNSNIVNGTSVAILIQYGHGTGTGGYVVGRNYINPAIRSIFDKIAAEVWRKVNE